MVIITVSVMINATLDNVRMRMRWGLMLPCLILLAGRSNGWVRLLLLHLGLQRWATLQAKAELDQPVDRAERGRLVVLVIEQPHGAIEFIFGFGRAGVALAA